MNWEALFKRLLSAVCLLSADKSGQVQVYIAGINEFLVSLIIGFLPGFWIVFVIRLAQEGVLLTDVVEIAIGDSESFWLGNLLTLNDLGAVAVEPSGNHGNANFITHVFVNNSTKDEIDIGAGGFFDNRSSLIDLKE